ncbi:MAG: DNA-binding transcriptional MocR family regulator [Candidatus Azotimanducaceae bacterium]|jgi:DNA-binding transcriptional MocR family regulator
MALSMQKTESKSSLVKAPKVVAQPVSVTRKMAASLPGLRQMAASKGLKMHHLGAGYPHPEVTDPRGFIAHKAAYYQHLREKEGLNDPSQLPEYLRESFSYTDTLGPQSVRQCFAQVYGADWQVQIDPAKLVPTVGATGGISLLCSLFERSGEPLAFITDAPTYAGFLARASLGQQTRIYSVDMDEEGPIIDSLRNQIEQARSDGRFVPFYYTVPDGHNPAGFSFSQSRRQAIMAVMKEYGLLVVEDAPYIYISYADGKDRPQPFFSIDPEQTVHLFTGSKIGFPGPRVGFLYSQAQLEIFGGKTALLTDLIITEASGDILFQNPEALYGMEALLHDENMVLRSSLWPVAEDKLVVYRDNRQIMLAGLERELGAFPEKFAWTQPGAGFFTVFTFIDEKITVDEAFVGDLAANFGIVVIPMYPFYPDDAKLRNSRAGLNQLRLSFCFSESVGNARRDDLKDAVQAFCDAVKQVSGMS